MKDINYKFYIIAKEQSQRISHACVGYKFGRQMQLPFSSFV